MCDAASIFSSMVFGALSVLPGNRYIGLALLSALLIAHTANGQRQTQKLCEVDRATRVREGIMERARPSKRLSQTRTA
jgi:general stress protein CsbA